MGSLISTVKSLDEAQGPGWKTSSQVVAVSGKRDDQHYTLLSSATSRQRSDEGEPHRLALA
jgi:hypothetical protein